MYDSKHKKISLQQFLQKLLRLTICNHGCSMEDSTECTIASNLDDSQLSQLSQITEAGSSDKNLENKFIDHEWGSNLLKGFSKLYKEKEFVDVTLCVEGREFSCHKNVLAISSPFFMAMFSSDMVESSQEKITLKELDSLTMELVLDYIYTGN